MSIIIRHYSSSVERRVVVTGLGVVSSLGINVETVWNNVLSGKCAIKNLPAERYKLPCQVAASIDSELLAQVRASFNKSELKSMAPATMYALYAANQAIQQAKLSPVTDEQKQRIGVAIGTGMVDLEDICDTNDALRVGYNKVSPFFVPRILPNMSAGHISIKYGFAGPNHSVSTACATGLHSIGDAFRFIKHNDADVMICGATEACISPLAIAGFCRLRALSTNFNGDPTKSSRPFDTDRDGFVMGEGAAVLVLEELEHAKNRQAEILGEIFGYGLSGDASHLTAPNASGSGARLAMLRAIKDAKVSCKDIGYVNAHATSTPLGDAIEARAIKSVFGENISKAGQFAVSSSKGHHGHLLGSAGNLECIFTLLACKHGILPPTINLTKCNDEFCDINFVANEQQSWKRIDCRKRMAIKNSFGFGGTNAALCVGEY